MFDRRDYDLLKELAFRDDWPGYTPSIVESGDGDGVWDEDKQYAHVAPKYFDEGPSDYQLEKYYAGAFIKAANVARALDVPEQFMPGRDSTMRILYYPPGAGAAAHTDFCLFTLSLFRDGGNGFRYQGYDAPAWGAAVSVTHEHHRSARRQFPGIHFGELWSEIVGHYPDRHEVVSTPGPQRSIVFFVMPPLDAVLPSGLTVGDWLKERKERSRKER